MSQISLEEVYSLARLAHIALSDEQAAEMQQKLTQILGFVERLNQVNTEGVEPTYQVTGLMNVTREDEAIDYGVTPTELLKNAPTKQDGSLKVKRVLQ